MFFRFFAKIKIVFSNFVWFLRSLFWRRETSIVLFGSWFGEKFADNSRFLFQYLSAHKENYGLTHVVWVTKNLNLRDELRELGYESYEFGSEESKYYHKKAKYHIICNSSCGHNADIEILYSFGAVRVNLWHGIGVVKRFGKASQAVLRNQNQHKLVYSVISWLQQTRFWRLFFVYPGGWGDFYLLSPNEISNKQFRESFGYIPQSRLIQSTYPRVHPNYALLKKEKSVLEKIKQYNKIVLYMPTFRLGKQSILFSDLGRSLKDILKKENILWIQKAHSADNFIERGELEENILALSPNFETNVIFPYISLLVTDYSSVATDARYFNKPVLFYMPDYEDYKKGENGLTDEAEELLSGPRFYDVDSLRRQIVHLVFNPNMAKPQNYTEIRNKYWGKDVEISDVWEKISKVK